VTVFVYNMYQHSLNRPIRDWSVEASECEYLKHTNRGKRQRVSNLVTDELGLNVSKNLKYSKETPNWQRRQIDSKILVN